MHAKKRSIVQAEDLLRKIPQVEKLLHSAGGQALLEAFPRGEVVGALRQTLDDLRADIQSAGAGKDSARDAELEALATSTDSREIINRAETRLRQRQKPHHARVINATGILLHTGLGRAVLPESAVEALTDALSGSTVVEVDPQSGERNRREAFVAGILSELTAAESAVVVNNNAAATLIILAALARGREVIVSRGQLVEIGGSYRIPDILDESGAKLVEVGTTNRTYARDYEKALGPDTGMLLQVHTSNYEISGFSHHTPLEELVALGRQHGVPVVSDLGSGCFVDMEAYGFRHEPLVTDVMATGADLVCFSGDKLLGGPQAGLILGRREWIETIRKHPLYRALRVDKMTLIALEAVLRLYRDPVHLEKTLPALRMLTSSIDEIEARATTFAGDLRRLADDLGAALSVDCVPSAAQMGSGSLPAQEIPSHAAALRIDGLSAEALAAALRSHSPSVFGRVHNDRVLIDFRTLLPGEERVVEAALRRILADAGSAK